jgi:hypothetical protein
MSDDKIYNDTITIESVEQKDSKITIVAHNRNRYGFWTTKKDGTDSAPYSQFQTMGLKKGDTVRIGYVIEPYRDKMGVGRESKKIINFQETNEAPSQTPPRQESPRGEAPVRSQGMSSDAFGRRLGVQGHINALLSNPNYYSVENNIDLSLLVKEAIAIEDEAEKQLNPSPLRQAVARHAPSVVDDDLPVIQTEGIDVDVDSIPF